MLDFRIGKPLAVSFLASCDTRFLPEDPVPEVHETYEAPCGEGKHVLFTYFGKYIYICVYIYAHVFLFMNMYVYINICMPTSL